MNQTISVHSLAKKKKNNNNKKKIKNKILAMNLNVQGYYSAELNTLVN